MYAMTTVALLMHMLLLTLQRSAQIIISSRSRSIVHRDMRGIMSYSAQHRKARKQSNE
jgi:hypothetical protein